MIEIQLSKGRIAIIDEDDFDKVSIYSWHFDRYAKAVKWDKEAKKNRHLYMHRLIMNAPKGLDVDHINGNKLDNRKINLRVCSRSINQYNPQKPTRAKSGLRGVYKEYNRSCRWFAQVKINGKLKRLGRYDTPEEAHAAYLDATKEFRIHKKPL